MPDQPTYRSQVIDHLGFVAGMFDALGMGESIDQATQQHPDMRDLTVGIAVKAMVLNGLGLSIKRSTWSPDSFTISPPTNSCRPALSISTRRAFMSMGATTATRNPKHRSCTSPAVIAGIIDLTSLPTT